MRVLRKLAGSSQACHPKLWQGGRTPRDRGNPNVVLPGLRCLVLHCPDHARSRANQGSSPVRCQAAAGPRRRVCRGCGLTRLQGLPVESTICLAVLPLRSSRTVRGEAALPQRTDCTSTGGLVALVVSAGPDTNRSAGLHSLFVVASRRDTGLVELARRRSDLWMHLRAHALGKIVVVDSVNPPGPARPWRNPRA